jgi:hypothetical protein
VSCTSSVRKGGDQLGAALSAVTPLTSSLIASRGRSSTPPTSMTTPTRMTGNKGDNKKKNRFGDKKKKKKLF